MNEHLLVRDCFCFSAVRGELQNGLHLIACDTELIDKFIDARPEDFQTQLRRAYGFRERPYADADAGNALDSETLRQSIMRLRLNRTSTS